MDHRYKKTPKKSLLSLLKSQEQTVGVKSKARECVLRIQRGGHTPKPPLQPDTLNTPLPSPHIRNKLALGSKQGALLFSLLL